MKGQYKTLNIDKVVAFAQLVHKINGKEWFSDFVDGLKLEITNNNGKYIEGFFEGKATRTSTSKEVFDGDVYVKCRFFLHIPR